MKKTRLLVNQHWNLDLMENWLTNYEDKQVIEYLKFGWPLNAHNTKMDNSIPLNQLGARNNPEKVCEYLKAERKARTLIGPFRKNPFGKFSRFSPLDAIPKKGSQDLRIILNLSYPFEGDSVNSSIEKSSFANHEDMTLRYPSVDDLAKIIRRKGRRARIFITDLSKAYRQLFSCPSSINLLCYCFDGLLYFDVTLSMGSRSAAYCCQRTTNTITHIFQNHGYDDVNYLDDLGAAEEEAKADEAFDCLGWILSSIGIKESVQKATPPHSLPLFWAFYSTLFP